MAAARLAAMIGVLAQDTDRWADDVWLIESVP
jgi:hypothetical protein